MYHSSYIIYLWYNSSNVENTNSAICRIYKFNLFSIYVYMYCLLNNQFAFLSGATLSDNDVIILAPPTNISVTEGDTVSLPCVGSQGTPPTFTVGGVSQTSSQYSLDFVSIATTAAGDYVCQIGTTATTVSVSVTPLSE